MGEAPFKDEDGISLRDGDYITFSFGIPPISVLCRLESANGTLHVECLEPPDVRPKRETLARLMRLYQVWKAPQQRVAVWSRDWTLADQVEKGE